jgi:hypothetical protein
MRQTPSGADTGPFEIEGEISTQEIAGSRRGPEDAQRYGSRPQMIAPVEAADVNSPGTN